MERKIKSIACDSEGNLVAYCSDNTWWYCILWNSKSTWKRLYIDNIPQGDGDESAIKEDKKRLK